MAPHGGSSGPPETYPDDVGGTGTVVHGISFDGDAMTLVGAWPSSITALATEITIRSSKLSLNAETVPISDGSGLLSRPPTCTKARQIDCRPAPLTGASRRWRLDEPSPR